MWTFSLHKWVVKFFEKHPELAEQFYAVVKKILKDPYGKISADIKPLAWSTKCFRLRISKYRFLYEVRDHEILVYFYDADSRGAIYK